MMFYVYTHFGCSNEQPISALDPGSFVFLQESGLRALGIREPEPERGEV